MQRFNQEQTSLLLEALRRTGLKHEAELESIVFSVSQMWSRSSGWVLAVQVGYLILFPISFSLSFLDC